jgi:formylglycine-generating enzyme required for sulfatase activity
MHNHKVGEKAPTGLGLYDMNGNLWEWFADLYRPSNYAISHYDYPSGNDMISGDVVLNPINNAFGVASPPVRYFCGGFWWSNNDAFRAGYRGSAFANSRGYHLGFRPAFLSPFAP